MSDPNQMQRLFGKKSSVPNAAPYGNMNTNSSFLPGNNYYGHPEMQPYSNSMQSQMNSFYPSPGCQGNQGMPPQSMQNQKTLNLKGNSVPGETKQGESSKPCGKPASKTMINNFNGCHGTYVSSSNLSQAEMTSTNRDTKEMISPSKKFRNDQLNSKQRMPSESAIPNAKYPAPITTTQGGISVTDSNYPATENRELVCPYEAKETSSFNFNDQLRPSGETGMEESNVQGQGNYGKMVQSKMPQNQFGINPQMNQDNQSFKVKMIIKGKSKNKKGFIGHGGPGKQPTHLETIYEKKDSPMQSSLSERDDTPINARETTSFNSGNFPKDTQPMPMGQEDTQKGNMMINQIPCSNLNISQDVLEMSHVAHKADSVSEGSLDGKSIRNFDMHSKDSSKNQRDVSQPMSMMDNKTGITNPLSSFGNTSFGGNAFIKDASTQNVNQKDSSSMIPNMVPKQNIPLENPFKSIPPLSSMGINQNTSSVNRQESSNMTMNPLCGFKTNPVNPFKQQTVCPQNNMPLINQPNQGNQLNLTPIQNRNNVGDNTSKSKNFPTPSTEEPISYYKKHPISSMENMNSEQNNGFGNGTSNDLRNIQPGMNGMDYDSPSDNISLSKADGNSSYTMSCIQSKTNSLGDKGYSVNPQEISQEPSKITFGQDSKIPSNVPSTPINEGLNRNENETKVDQPQPQKNIPLKEMFSPLDKNNFPLRNQFGSEPKNIGYFMSHHNPTEEAKGNETRNGLPIEEETNPMENKAEAPQENPRVEEPNERNPLNTEADCLPVRKSHYSPEKEDMKPIDEEEEDINMNGEETNNNAGGDLNENTLGGDLSENTFGGNQSKTYENQLGNYQFLSKCQKKQTQEDECDHTAAVKDVFDAVNNNSDIKNQYVKPNDNVEMKDAYEEPKEDTKDLFDSKRNEPYQGPIAPQGNIFGNVPNTECKKDSMNHNFFRSERKPEVESNHSTKQNIMSRPILQNSQGALGNPSVNDNSQSVSQNESENTTKECNFPSRITKASLNDESKGSFNALSQMGNINQGMDSAMNNPQPNQNLIQNQSQNTQMNNQMNVPSVYGVSSSGNEMNQQMPFQSNFNSMNNEGMNPMENQAAYEEDNSVNYYVEPAPGTRLVGSNFEDIKVCPIIERPDDGNALQDDAEIPFALDAKKNTFGKGSKKIISTDCNPNPTNPRFTPVDQQQKENRVMNSFDFFKAGKSQLPEVTGPIYFKENKYPGFRTRVRPFKQQKKY
ncbi:MAG: hypothetical protein MJ252_01630 [archaeon]|nr:hypothetical protein [archaeon]